jgi:two-component system sensor histidine kinase PilS (NtrC family)
MVEKGLHIPKEDLSGRLQNLMFLRVLFVSILLGASLFIQAKETKIYFGDIQTSHYLIIVAIYFLTFIYILFLKKGKDLTALAYIQLLVDTFFVTAIIYSTGGINSIFSFLYILTIINASIILYRKGGMTIASCSSILYGLLLDLHYFGVIHPLGGHLTQPYEYQNLYFFYMIVVNIAAFYLVAFLSSYPSEQARKSQVELRAKQDDIVKLEALNEWIIGSMNSGLIALDGHNRIILFNPAAREIFGLESDRAIGHKLFEPFPFLDDYMELKGEKLELKNKHLASFIDFSYQRLDEKKILRLSMTPLNLPGGGRRGQILIFQDMTEMKRIEEEMKRVEGLALVGELAAGIAHEVRNPMASISGSIQMLKEGLDRDAVDSRLMDIILREINRLNLLVNDFLLFARPRPVDLQTFDLDQLIADSLELFQNSKKWLSKMHVETDFYRDIRVESDPEQIKQVLWNLFVNASEAMPDGGSLHIRTQVIHDRHVLGDNGTSVKVTIRDTGEGFSEEALRHIFTPFFTTKDGGTGLGLAIVKRIMNGLKGEVYGKTHPEGGAEITIFLPSILVPSAGNGLEI